MYKCATQRKLNRITKVGYIKKMNKTIRYTSPDEQGYYGKFGGAYIPEMLHRNVEELRTKYLEIIYEEGFQKEFHELLKDYVGRPTPLYFAND